MSKEKKVNKKFYLYKDTNWKAINYGWLLDYTVYWRRYILCMRYDFIFVYSKTTIGEGTTHIYL